MLRLEKRSYTYILFPTKLQVGACFLTLILKKIHSEMALFQQQVTKVEQSCFGSEDFSEILTSTFEIIVTERTPEAPLSSEHLALLMVNHQSTPHLFDFTKGSISTFREKELTLALRSEQVFKMIPHLCL